MYKQGGTNKRHKQGGGANEIHNQGEGDNQILQTGGNDKQMHEHRACMHIEVHIEVVPT